MKKSLRLIDIGIIILILIILILVVYYRVYFNIDSSQKNGFYGESEILIENLDTPWAIDFLPSGEMVFTERGGKVSLFDFDTKETRIIGNIDVSEVSESGLLGIAVDTEFKDNGFIYVYYTHDSGNRVSRFTFDSNELEDNKLEDEFILLDNIPNAQFHDGGRIKFGPDSLLYIRTGDATVPSSAQEINSLAGKILRMNKDGSIPEDNPFGNYVYSYGHRNPQGIAWNSEGTLFSSEHGPTKNDEINILEKGKNYGWPANCEHDYDLDYDFINPIRCYTEFTLAPSGIAFYQEELYVAGLKGNQLRRIKFDEAYENITEEEALFEELGRIREVVEKDGYLYITTNNRDGRGIPQEGDDKILRISFKV